MFRRRKWPVYSNENDAPWVLERMNALMDAGLIEQTVDGDEWVFSLSEKGRKAWQPYQDFCYGHLFISQIKRYNLSIQIKYYLFLLWCQRYSCLG